jgi:hypothetical protein
MGVQAMMRPILIASFLACLFLASGPAYAAVKTVCFSGCNSSSIQDAVYASSSYDEVRIIERTTAGISTSGLKAYYPFDNLNGNLTNVAGILSPISSMGTDGNMSIRPNTNRTSGKLGGAFWYISNGGPIGYSQVHSDYNGTQWRFLHYQGGGATTFYMSMNLWIKITEYPTAGRAAIFSDARTIFSEPGMEMVLTNQRTMRASIHGSQTILSLTTPVDALPADGNFHMVTLVIDASDTNSSNAARIYVDNQMKASSNINPQFGSSGSPTRPPSIAYSAEGISLNSTMDEFSIWDRALTDGERSALWNGGSGAVLGNYSQYYESVIVNVTGLTLTSNTSTMPVVWSNSSLATINMTFDNVTIRNLSIVYNGTDTSFGAVTALNRSNITVANSTINNEGSGNSGYGIYFSGTSSSKIENNTINTAGGNGNYGIYLTGSSSNISQNTISTSGTYNNYGIYLLSSSSSSTDQNTISTGTSGDRNYGIYLNSVSNSAFTSNTISPRGTDGSNYGVYLVSSTYNAFMRNIVSTSDATTANSHGILLSSSSSNTFRSNNVTTSDVSISYGLYLDTSNNNTFYDSEFNALEAYDVFLTGTTAGNDNYFVDVSFNENDIGASASNVQTKVFVQYRADVTVRNTSNNLLNGTLVFGNDTNSVDNAENPTSNFSTTTNSTGQIPTQFLTKFMANGTYNSASDYLYFNDYTITASNSGYVDNSTVIDIISSFSVDIFLKLAPALNAIFGKGTDSYGLFFDLIYQDNIYAMVNSVNASYALPSGWSHVAMTFDSGTIKLYVNGQLASSASTSATPAASSKSLMIGNGTDLLIDEVTFRSGALSASQIEQHYRVGPGIKAAIQAIGSGSLGRTFNIFATMQDGSSFSGEAITPQNLLAGTFQTAVLSNVTGTPRTVRVVEESCNAIAEAVPDQFAGSYC